MVTTRLIIKLHIKVINSSSIYNLYTRFYRPPSFFWIIDKTIQMQDDLLVKKMERVMTRNITFQHQIIIAYELQEEKR